MSECITPQNKEYFQVWTEEEVCGVLFVQQHGLEYETAEEANLYLKQHTNNLHESAKIKRCIRL